MEDAEYRRFDEFIDDGFFPHQQPKAYVCGWCGLKVSATIGLHKHEERHQVLGGPPVGPQIRDADIRICPECWVATTFRGRNGQYPGPMKGDNLDARQKSDDAKTVVALYDEARIALSQGAYSCSVLMCRKLLMHVAVEQGAGIGLKFIEYVNFLKDNGIVGKPQHALLDRIRDAGNQENHEIVRASPEQAEELLSFATLLIRSVYFSG